MRIVKNLTGYDGRLLRRIFCAVHRELAKSEGKLHSWGRLNVYIEYRISRVAYSKGTVSGRANLRGTWMKLKLPKDEVSPRRVAWLFRHELMHSYGYGHDNYRDPHESTFAWADDLVNGKPNTSVSYREVSGRIDFGSRQVMLLDVPPKVKPKPQGTDAQLDKYERVMVRIESWEKKQQRAINALHKLARSRRYYEKVLQAAGKLEGGTDD